MRLRVLVCCLAVIFAVAAHSDDAHKKQARDPIALNTTAARILAAGIIESTSGGFRFPDGTVQASAMTGAAAATSAPSDIEASPRIGITSAYARADHAHAHGTQAGGSLHLPATDSAAGFMSAADKAFLDGATHLSGGYSLVRRNDTGKVHFAQLDTSALEFSNGDGSMAARIFRSGQNLDIDVPNGEIRVSSNLSVLLERSLEFGWGYSFKHLDAGTITYRNGAGYLDIIGAGATAGTRKVMVQDHLAIPGTGMMEFGANVSGKEINAGKIGYQVWTGNALDIVGAGTSAVNSRNVKLWDNASVSNNLSVGGTLTKAAGSFRIDHPLDPDNKYLSHSFVESPDMMNVYNGNVILDYHGEAVVELPQWFEALNRDFRYQLTAIGLPAPNLYIAEKIAGNRFRIAGGAPAGEVSWQVTGIRRDAYAQAHRIPVEEAKAEEDRGRYLHPAELGKAEDRGIHAMREQPPRD